MGSGRVLVGCLVGVVAEGIKSFSCLLLLVWFESVSPLWGSEF